MKYLLALDAGPGSIRSVIFDIYANQIAFANREWSHLSEDGIEGSMSFDFDNNWNLVKECIKESIKKANINPKEIVAISATSFREGIILYDKNKNELWGVANVDSRAYKEVEFLKKTYEGIEEKFYKISGQTFALGAIPRLLWVKNNKPDIYEKTAYISMVGDWILKKLSNEIAVDPSNAGTTGIFNLQTRTWAKEIMNEVGLKDDIFPPVLESGEVLGKVTKEISNEFGFSYDTLVVMGGGDVQLGSAGLGVVDINEVAILGGSFWQQVINIPKDTTPPQDLSIRINPHVIKNQSQAEGITFFTGLIMRWFRDVFCEYEKLVAKAMKKDIYEYLEGKALFEPVGSNGIIPIFSDEMKYGKWYHASCSFLNLDIDKDKCNKFTLFRALEENAAIVSNINLEKIKAFSGVEFDSITFAGGASKGKLWAQILSDVTNKEVKVPKIKEATALGAAYAAGVGAKIYDNIASAAKEFIEFERYFEPNKKNHQIYAELAKKWQQVYKKQLELVDLNLTKSMWRAPGV